MHFLVKFKNKAKNSNIKKVVIAEDQDVKKNIVNAIAPEQSVQNFVNAGISAKIQMLTTWKKENKRKLRTI